MLELTITGALLMTVMAMILGIFMSIQRTSVREESRARGNEAVRATMDVMVKEIRQATMVCSGSGASLLDMDTYIDGLQKRVIYAASGTTITRQEGTATFSSCGAITAGAPVTVVERLTDAAVFSYYPSVTGPSAVTVALNVEPESFASDGVIITLTSEAQLRNGA